MRDVEMSKELQKADFSKLTLADVLQAAKAAETLDTQLTEQRPTEVAAVSFAGKSAKHTKHRHHQSSHSKNSSQTDICSCVCCFGCVHCMFVCVKIDMKKMPLGKLSKRQIESAYSVLNEALKVSWS